MKDDIPEFTIDRTKITVLEEPDDTDDIEYWRNTTVKERLQHAERLRRSHRDLELQSP